MKKLLILDFDGVLHSYKSGWLGADNCPDEPVPGAIEFCEDVVKVFDVMIVSARCAYPGGPQAIKAWLDDWGFPEALEVSDNGVKPPAFLTIDDRAITFTGVWPKAEDLLDFRTWLKRDKLDLERHADLEHQIWSSWMEYMFSKGYYENGKWVMPQWAVERWTRQMRTPYKDLSEKEKESDREQVQKHIYLMEQLK